MKFAHFTAPNGKTVGINPDQVVSDHAPESGEVAPGARCVLDKTVGFQAVKETCAEAEKRLEG